MRRIGLTCLIIIMIVGVTSAIAAADKNSKKRIAVGDFKTDWARGQACQGHASNYGETLAASLRTRLAETGAFSVLSREQMQKLMREHDLAMTGLADASNAKVLGQFLQADLLLSGDLLCNPKTVEFNVNLIDVETTEIVWAHNYNMKDLNKINRMLKDIAKLAADYAKTGKVAKSAGDTEDLMLIDSKILHTATQMVIADISRSIPKASARIEEVNAYGETIKVKITGAANKVWPGLRMKVVRSDEDVGWIFLKKTGPGTVEAGSDDDISSFEEGDHATTQDYKPKVAIGFISDKDEDNEKLVEMFKKNLVKEMSESDKLDPVDDQEVEKILDKMGETINKKELEKLYKKGVDLIITGRFLGGNGDRRIDFEVLSAYDGKRVMKLSGDTRL
jgi:curli biogenesis system outer membrane secretion channel CsgG